jgi:hypothetical protein
MQATVIYVPICKCGNLHCDDEALPERCRYQPWPRPDTWNDLAATITEADSEGD